MGLAKQRVGVKTIAGTLNLALNTLLKASIVNYPQLVSSSRTDKGVHAFMNALHVDLQHRLTGQEFEPDKLTSALNSWLTKEREQIKIVKVLRVNDNFHCRFLARHRTYVYRVCLCREPDLYWQLPFPPIENERSLLVKHKTDVEKMKEGGRILSGTHDFTSFTTKNYLRDHPHINPVKTLEVQVREGRGLMEEYMPYSKEHFQYWDLLFKSGSFLYRQVRRMVSALLLVGRDTLTMEDLQEMLEHPQPKHQDMLNKQMLNVVPYGLYLKEVDFKEEDLINQPNFIGRDYKLDPRPAVSLADRDQEKGTYDKVSTAIEESSQSDSTLINPNSYDERTM